MPTDRFKNERGHPDDKKRDDWRFTGDPKEYSKYKDRVAYDLKKLDTTPYAYGDADNGTKQERKTRTGHAVMTLP